MSAVSVLSIFLKTCWTISIKLFSSMYKLNWYITTLFYSYISDMIRVILTVPDWYIIRLSWPCWVEIAYRSFVEDSFNKKKKGNIRRRTIPLNLEFLCRLEVGTIDCWKVENSLEWAPFYTSMLTNSPYYLLTSIIIISK